MSDLPAVERIEAHEVRPDDVVVVKVPRSTTMQEANELDQVLARRLPPGARWVVATSDMDIEVYRQQEAAP